MPASGRRASSISPARRFSARRRPNVEAEIERWPSASIAEARRRIDRAVMLMRLQPALEEAAISEALHDVALEARRLKRGARD